jgi:hypothetical protein
VPFAVLAPGSQSGNFWIHSYASPNTVRVIKSKRMRLAGYVARTRDEKCIQNFGLET